MNPKGLRILTYHGFGSDRAPTVVEPSLFVDTLAAFAENEFRCVDLEEWIAHGRPDEPKGYALAFDDGLGSILRVADAMSRFGATATIFVVTGRVGADNAWPGQPSWVPRDRLLDWSELIDLCRLGFRLGAHGVSHARLDHLNMDRVEDELRASRAVVETRTGRPCPLLAYPYGTSTRDVRRIAARHFTAAFGTRLGCSDRDQDRFDVARLDAHVFRSPAARKTLTTDKIQSRIRWRRAIQDLRRWGSKGLSSLRFMRRADMVDPFWKGEAARESTIDIPRARSPVREDWEGIATREGASFPPLAKGGYGGVIALDSGQPIRLGPPPLPPLRKEGKVAPVRPSNTLHADAHTPGTMLPSRGDCRVPGRESYRQGMNV